MLFRSTADVTIPAHKLKQFKTAVLRRAPSEHRSVAELGNVSIFQIARAGANATVRVLIDAEPMIIDPEDGDYTGYGDGANSSADECIMYGVIKVGGIRKYTVETSQVG